MGEGVWETLAWNMFRGFVCALFSTIPLLILSSICRRNFCYREIPWTDKEKKQILLFWKVEEVFVVCLGILYCVCCNLFVIAFVANIAEEFDWQWFSAAVFMFVKELIVAPMLLALAYLTLTAYAGRYRPHLVPRFPTNFGIPNIPEPIETM